MRIVCAVGSPAEGEAIGALLTKEIPGSLVAFPASIAEIEALHSKNQADVIITDFSFQGGGLADWLILWPLPAVLIADPEVSSERIGQSIKDESSLLIERRADGGHLARLPLLVRKALGIRESVNRQNTFLQITERRYLDLVQAIPDIVYSLDGEGRFTYLNDATRELGFDPSHLIGRHFSEILEPEEVSAVSRARVLQHLRGVRTGDENAPKLFDERRTGSRMTRNLEVRIKLGDNESRYGAVFAYGEVSSTGFEWPEFEGQGIGTVGIIRDITARKRYEKDLEALVAERERLLLELHHRVRNNLQIICSLMHIEESSVIDAHDRGIFVRTRAQVEAMAFVHDLFCDPESLEHVDMGEFGQRLVENLSEIYDAPDKRLSLKAETSGLNLDLDSAITVALLSNELMSESLEREFPEGERFVHLSIEGGTSECSLELRDNAHADALKTSDLVEALASQLRGGLAVGPGEGGTGRHVIFRFPRRWPAPTSC